MTEQGKKNIVWGVFAAFMALLVIGALSGNSPEAKAKYFDKGVIDTCWQDQARKSLAPDQARAIAAMCEKMEADYAKKYGERP